MELEINKELVVSTAHLPPGLAAAMGEEFNPLFNPVEPIPIPHLVYEHLQYGFLVWTRLGMDDYDPDQFPSEILAVIELARELGCKWVRFDADGMVLEDEAFETWDW